MVLGGGIGTKSTAEMRSPVLVLGWVRGVLVWVAVGAQFLTWRCGLMGVPWLLGGWCLVVV